MDYFLELDYYQIERINTSQQDFSQPVNMFLSTILRWSTVKSISKLIINIAIS